MTDLAKPPVIHPSAFVAEGAVISGDVTLERDVSIWHNAVLRADCDRIVVGAGSIMPARGTEPLRYMNSCVA